MSATGVPHSSSASAAGTPRGRADAATIKLVDELKTLASEVLGKGIERMFDGADDMLFEMARRATNNKDQRIYFDTMRVVRLGRPKIGRIFREEIVKGFAPESKVVEEPSGDMAFENLSLQESKSLEETIAISTMATKAENLYSQLLFELGRRIDWLIKEKHAPLIATALAPATISGAFRRSAEALDVEFDIELVIFKLFDRLVISDLGELYTRVLRFLDQSGVKSAAIGGAPPRVFATPGGMPAGAPGPMPEGAQAMPDGAMPAGAMPMGGMPMGAMPGGTMPAAPGHYAYASPPMMDAATLNALRNLSASSAMAPAAAGGGAGYAGGGHYYYGQGDVQLGTDLATAAAGQMVPGWEAPRAFAYVQRAGAVGQMFNDLMQDPTLPATLKPRFDNLRFSVIKSALHDASFFADRQHPVRGLMNELTTLAASARASGMEALRRIEELVGQIQSQFDIAAEEVRSQSALPSPVDEKTLDQFFAQQKEDARQRRLAIIERTRRVVAEELQLLTLSRKLPEGIWPLLNSGWAPLAALRLLKQGADSEAWREGMTLVRRILDSADPRAPAARSAQLLDPLEHEVRERLAEIGMLDERIAALVRSWRESLDEVEAVAIARAAVAAPVAAPAPPVEALLVTAEPEPPAAPIIVSDITPPLPPVAAEEQVAPAVPPDASALLEEIDFGESTAAEDDAELRALIDEHSEPVPASSPPEAAPAPVVAPPVIVELPPPAATLVEQPQPASAVPDPVTLLDLLMVLSSWFRVYDHDRGQNRWLKVVSHHPADSTVTFAEFNGQNKLQLRTQVFLDDLVAGRAEPIDLGPAARRSLDAYLNARRESAEAAAKVAA